LRMYSFSYVLLIFYFGLDKKVPRPKVRLSRT